MQKILKRLELIKTAIILEDEEIIELQVMKLRLIEDDGDLANILAKIESEDYGAVMQDIENYLQKFSGMVVYEDPELQGLRLELKALERKLQELSSQKEEQLLEIHDFNLQYRLRLGGIIEQILILKEKLLQEMMQKKRDAFEKLNEAYREKKKEYDEQRQKVNDLESELENMDEFDERYDELYEELQREEDELYEQDEKLKETKEEAKKAKKEYEEDETTKEYEEVKEDSENFKKEYKEAKENKQLEISEEEKAELKKLYRKASRFCHPDLVSQELKEQAHAMMQKLNEAYNQHDIKAVKKMLALLESGRGFDIASDTITNTAQLKEKIADIRELIRQNEIELEKIKEEEIFQIIQEYDDLEEYFDALEIELEKEYARLSKKEEENTKHKNDKAEDDEYWGNMF